MNRWVFRLALVGMGLSIAVGSACDNDVRTTHTGATTATAVTTSTAVSTGAGFPCIVICQDCNCACGQDRETQVVMWATCADLVGDRCGPGGWGGSGGIGATGGTGGQGGLAGAGILGGGGAGGGAPGGNGGTAGAGLEPPTYQDCQVANEFCCDY